MNKLVVFVCVFLIIVTSSINPYIKKSIINSKKDVYMPFEVFYIFISFLSATLVSFMLFFYKWDYIYLILGIIMCFMTFFLFITKVKDNTYPMSFYTKCILSSFLTIIPSFLFVFLITRKDVSYLDPIIKPLILILIFMLGVFVFGEEKQNTTRKWICLIGIVILVGIFQMDKTNLNVSPGK